MLKFVPLLNEIINFYDNGGAPSWVLGDINQDESIDDLDVLRGIREFIDKEYYKHNKNLAYLGGIIRNINQTKESQIEAEKNVLGLNPPEIKKEK